MTERTEFLLDFDRGHIIERPVGSRFAGDEIVWAAVRTGDGWNDRAMKIVNLLNASNGELQPEEKK